MSLFAIGDLHLHFQSELKAAGQITGRIWKNHEAKLLKHCRLRIRDDDVLVLACDHSWGRNLAECEQDLAYIAALPGRKVLLRGNHDMFWDANKTAALNRLYEGRLFFLQNNFFPYRDASGKDWALVGTKGFTYEGPFFLDRQGRIIGWDREAEEHARKLVEREAQRLRLSFEAARSEGHTRFIMFLHYPPTDILETDSVFTSIAEEYGAAQVIYAHCHGQSRFHDSIEGTKNGILYRLVSGDYLRWDPAQIL